MVSYARGTDGFFKSGESQQIIRFLSKTQTPEAVAARRLQSASINQEFENEPLNASTEKGTKDSARIGGRSNVQGAVVILLLTVALGTLIVRRPKRTAAKRAVSFPETSGWPLQRTLAPERIRASTRPHRTANT